MHAQNQVPRQVKPSTSLVAILCVAIVMILGAFAFFWNSNSKDLVQSLQRNDTTAPSTENIVAAGINNDGVLTTAELLFITESVQASTASLDPDTDFGGDALNKSKIGF